MATRRTSAPQAPKPPLELVMSRDDAKARLQERIEKGLELKQRRVETRETFEMLSNDYSKWNAFNSELLKRTPMGSGLNTVRIARLTEYFFCSVS